MFYNPCVFPALIAGLVLFQSGLFLAGTTENYTKRFAEFTGFAMRIH